MAGISVARTYTQVTASDSENICGHRMVSVYKYSRCLAGVNNTPGDASDFSRSYKVRVHVCVTRARFHLTFAHMSRVCKSSNDVTTFR